MRFLLALALLAGCGPEEIDVFLQIPEGTKSVIWAQEYHDRLTMEAFDVTPGAGLGDQTDISDWDEGALTLTAWLYDRELAEVRVMPGRQDLVQDGGQRVPEAATTLERVLDQDGGEGEWAEVEGPSGRARQARIPQTTPCIDYDVETVTLPSQGAMAGAVPVEGGALAVVGYAGETGRLEMFRVGSDGSRTQLLTQAPLNFQPTAVGRSDDGRLFVSGWCADAACRSETGFALSYGVIEYRLDQIDGPYRALEDVGDRPFSVVKRMGVDPNGPEQGAIYALTQYGRLHRFFEGSWSLVWDGMGNGDDIEGGRVLVVAPKEVYVAYREKPFVVHVVDGVASVEPTDRNDDAVTTVEKVGDRLLAGTGGGRVLERGPDGTWEELDSPPPANAILALAPYADGFLYTVFFGAILQYSEGWGYCDDPPVVAALNPFELFLLDDGETYFVAGDRVSGTSGERPDIHVALARPRPRGVTSR